jgi:hypothetical protein
MNEEFLKQRRLVLSSLSAVMLAGCARSFSLELDPFPCTRDIPFNTQLYYARLNGFRDLHLDRQEGPLLCWAAAIQAIYKYRGIELSQDDVIEKVRGETNRKGFGAASLGEIMDGLSGRNSSWKITNGVSREIVSDLMYGVPIILGLNSKEYQTGHVVVVHEAIYIHGYQNNKTYIDALKVWDPSKGFRTLSGCKAKEEIKFALHPWSLG